MIDYDKEIIQIEKARKNYEEALEDKHRSINKMKSFLEALLCNTKIGIVDKRTREQKDVK